MFIATKLKLSYHNRINRISFAKHSPFGNAFFTNNTSKSFDENIKGKYTKTLNEMSDTSSNHIFEEMKENFEDIIENLDREESILKSYQKQIFDETTIKHEMESSKKIEFISNSKDFFTGLSQTEFTKKSSEMIDAFRYNKKWDPSNKQNISKDYLDYSHVQKIPKLKNRIKSEEGEEPFSITKGIFDFTKALPNSVTEKKQMNELIGSMLEETDTQDMDEQQINDLIENAYQIMRGEGENADPHEIENTEINIGDADSQGNKEHEVYGRLSPHAREEIYKLHLAGWTLRDLSLRFGILPERAKFIVWSRQYFYEEILPNVDATTIRLALEKEMLYHINFPWTDYGLDLEDLAVREQGLFFSRYRWGELDSKPKEETQAKIKAISKDQPQRKYEIVTENFIGAAQSGYFVKSWIVNKGHGSNRVNKKFKSIIHHSKTTPNYLSDKLRMKAKEGPRKASFGYGIK